MSLVADYSNGRPDLAALKSAGFIGIARYCWSGTSTKNLDQAEINECAKLGFGILRVYEDDGGSKGGGPAKGYPQGAADAPRLLAAAQAQGQPTGTGLYFAVDTDKLSQATVNDYFRGVCDTLKDSGYRIGVYGPKAVCVAVTQACPEVVLIWQTETWDPVTKGHSVPLANANLYQRVGHTVAVPGVAAKDYDENAVCNTDWGQWYPGGQVKSFEGDEDMTQDEHDTLHATADAVVSLTDAVAKLQTAVDNLARGVVIVEGDVNKIQDHLGIAHGD